MIRWIALEWLLLLPVLGVVGWLWPRLRLYRPLRVLILVVAVLALARPEVRRLAEGLDLWVLVDRSDSAVDRMQARLPEWEALLADGRRAHDRIRYVEFADVVQDREQQDGAVFSGSGQLTRTGLAVNHALSHMSNQRANRILVLTDGFSTEPLEHLAERLTAQQVPLDYRLLGSGGEADVRIDRLQAPARVQAAEPYLVEVELSGFPDQLVDCEIFRDGARAGGGSVQLVNGRGVLRFTDRVAEPGGHRYHVTARADEDAFAGNNLAETWVDVAGGPRILLVTGYDQDPAAAVLRRQGFEVDVETDPVRLHPGRLTGARAVILNNIPAYRLPADFLGALPFFVQEQAGGLAMGGGRFSFGSGGYFESAIDGLLPVTMDLREEHRKLSVAMAIVMDRSGSMGMTVAGGRTKMDLANEGAGRAIELLGGRDLVAVFAVDSKAHAIVTLTAVAGRQPALVDTVRRIGSGGGGIFVYNGLLAAWEQLQGAAVGQRHVILFADAADAEQPDDYVKLLAEMTDQDTTVSVIGLGTEQDGDAEFLKDIAARGGGRIFFNANPADLPNLFAQEAVTVARSAFIEEPVPVRDVGGWLELAARPMPWMNAVDGYNLSYLRPEATAACVSTDEYQAPLVAFWRRGLGRGAAVSFPLGGEFSDATRNWEGYGDFLQTLTRWLMGEALPPGVGLRTRLDGTLLSVDLLYDDDDEHWESEIAARPPRIVLARSEGNTETHVWQRLAPGHYHTTVAMEARSTLRGAVQIGSAALPFGPITAGIDAEWAFDRERIHELETLAGISGGEERLDLATIWNAPRRSAFRDVRPWLYTALLAFLLLEALATRTGWTLPQWQPTRRRRAPPRTPPPAPRAPPAPKPPPPQDTDRHTNEHPEAHEDAARKRRERFARAKRGGG
jgi:hypothetical protein